MLPIHQVKRTPYGKVDSMFARLVEADRVTHAAKYALPEIFEPTTSHSNFSNNFRPWLVGFFLTQIKRIQ